MPKCPEHCPKESPKSNPIPFLIGLVIIALIFAVGKMAKDLMHAIVPAILIIGATVVTTVIIIGLITIVVCYKRKMNQSIYHTEVIRQMNNTSRQELPVTKTAINSKSSPSQLTYSYNYDESER